MTVLGSAPLGTTPIGGDSGTGAIIHVQAFLATVVGTVTYSRTAGRSIIVSPAIIIVQSFIKSISKFRLASVNFSANLIKTPGLIRTSASQYSVASLVRLQNVNRIVTSLFGFPANGLVKAVTIIRTLQINFNPTLIKAASITKSVTSKFTETTAKTLTSTKTVTNQFTATILKLQTLAKLFTISISPTIIKTPTLIKTSASQFTAAILKTPTLINAIVTSKITAILAKGISYNRSATVQVQYVVTSIAKSIALSKSVSSLYSVLSLVKTPGILRSVNTTQTITSLSRSLSHSHSIAVNFAAAIPKTFTKSAILAVIHYAASYTKIVSLSRSVTNLFSETTSKTITPLSHTVTASYSATLSKVFSLAKSVTSQYSILSLVKALVINKTVIIKYTPTLLKAIAATKTVTNQFIPTTLKTISLTKTAVSLITAALIRNAASFKSVLISANVSATLTVLQLIGRLFSVSNNISFTFLGRAQSRIISCATIVVFGQKTLVVTKLLSSVAIHVVTSNVRSLVKSFATSATGSLSKHLVASKILSIISTPILITQQLVAGKILTVNNHIIATHILNIPRTLLVTSKGAITHAITSLLNLPVTILMPVNLKLAISKSLVYAINVLGSKTTATITHPITAVTSHITAAQVIAGKASIEAIIVRSLIASSMTRTVGRIISAIQRVVYSSIIKQPATTIASDININSTLARKLPVNVTPLATLVALSFRVFTGSIMLSLQAKISSAFARHRILQFSIATHSTTTSPARIVGKLIKPLVKIQPIIIKNINHLYSTLTAHIAVTFAKGRQYFVLPSILQILLVLLSFKSLLQKVNLVQPRINLLIVQRSIDKSIVAVSSKLFGRFGKLQRRSALVITRISNSVLHSRLLNVILDTVVSFIGTTLSTAYIAFTLRYIASTNKLVRIATSSSIARLANVINKINRAA